TPVSEPFVQPVNQYNVQQNITSDDAENALSKSLQEAVASVDLESARREAQSQTFNFSQIAHPQTQIPTVNSQENFYGSSYTTQQAAPAPDLSAVEEMEPPSNVA